MKEAYSTKELFTFLNVTFESSVLRRAKREGWEAKPRAGRGGGNEWLVLSMPEATRAQINAHVAKAAENLPVPLPKLVSDVVVPDWAYEVAKARYRIVTEWKLFVSKAKGKAGIVAVTEQFLALMPMLLPAKVLEVAGAVSRPTLYRWDKALRDNNNDFEALADKRGGWQNGQAKGFGQISEEAEQAFLQVYLKPNQPSMSFAYACTEVALQRQNLAVPSYSSVRRYFQRFDSTHHDLVVLMREGEKAYTDKVGAYLTRDDKILQVGDVLVADGHKLNFLVQNPETGKPCRMTLIGWEDWASRMFVGFEIMVNENTQAIAVSLYRSILNLGKMPRAVYLDNGKAFKNKFFDGAAEVDIEEFDGLYARLGIHVHHSAPYVARTKIIERWWGDFDRQCEVSLPSYTGASIEGKPAHMMRNEEWQKKQHKKHVDKVPTVAEVVRIVTDFARWKAHQPHPTRPETTPYEFFMANRGEGFSVEEAAKLSRQFLHRKAINPKRCRFTMFGVEFESDVLHGINKELVVHYSYTDLSEVYVFDAGRLLCVAKPIATYNPMAKLFGDDLDMQKVKAAQKLVAGLRRDTRKHADALVAWGASTEVLTAMPWQGKASERKTPLVLSHDAVPKEACKELPAIGEAEMQELKALASRLQEERAKAPSYSTPAFFGSERERYEFLFDLAVVEKVELSVSDAEFMASYEQSVAYHSARKRYDEMREYFTQRTAMA